MIWMNEFFLKGHSPALTPPLLIQSTDTLINCKCILYQARHMVVNKIAEGFTCGT